MVVGAMEKNKVGKRECRVVTELNFSLMRGPSNLSRGDTGAEA